MPARPTCDRLFCLIHGWEHTPRWLSLEGGGDKVLRLPVTGVLARSRAAGWVLLETGLNPRFCRTPADVGQIYPGAPPELASDDPLLDGLAACGVALGDLAAAAVSHLHVDHAGGLPHLGGGPPVFVQGRELEFALERGTPRKAYWREDYADPAIDWHELDGDAEIVPGIEAVFTPGHTPGHMSYRVRMQDSGTWLFAVDAIDLQEGIDTGVPIGASVDPADAPLRRRSHERLVALAAAEGARLVPGHCPVTWPALRRPPEGYG